VGGALTGLADREDWEFGATGHWVAAHKRVLRYGMVIAGAAVLVVLQRPGPRAVLLVAAVVLVAIAVIEVVGRAVPARAGRGDAAQPRLFDSG
jgi:hypothetical protein